MFGFVLEGKKKNGATARLSCLCLALSISNSVGTSQTVGCARKCVAKRTRVVVP